MPDASGKDLENQGVEVFTQMGLTCLGDFGQVRLVDLDPDGSYDPGEHLELDYLIPYEKICLIGEITSRTGVPNIKDKIAKFRSNYNMLSKLKINRTFWSRLKVPEEDLDLFDNVREIRGFMIVTERTRFDLEIPNVSGIAICDRSAWNILKEYTECIGEYARYPFLGMFDLASESATTYKAFSKSGHGLIQTTGKRIASGNMGLADIYTFEASPYDLLPMARVFRRDQLPDLAPRTSANYQRPLIGDKLERIRRNVLTDEKFMFPNSILVVLSRDSEYDRDREELRIPSRYGVLSVIDGQHRLFSYAEPTIEERMGSKCKIMVTAIQFRGASEERVISSSARTFLEINSTQTPVVSSHNNAIAYEILGDTSQRAIAAYIILKVNERRNKSRGLFQTSQTTAGIIQVTTVLSALAPLVNVEKIISRQFSPKTGDKVEARGYANLFSLDISNPWTAQDIARQGIICIERYFDMIAGIFKHDWPQRDTRKNSSMEYAKVIAAFIKLLQRFIREGKDWSSVREETEKILKNVMRLRGMPEYNSVLFDPNSDKVPGAQPSVEADYRFLEANRTKAKSMRAIMNQASTRSKK